MSVSYMQCGNYLSLLQNSFCLLENEMAFAEGFVVAVSHAHSVLKWVVLGALNENACLLDISPFVELWRLHFLIVWPFPDVPARIWIQSAKKRCTNWICMNQIGSGDRRKWACFVVQTSREARIEWRILQGGPHCCVPLHSDGSKQRGTQYTFE